MEWDYRTSICYFDGCYAEFAANFPKYSISTTPCTGITAIIWNVDSKSLFCWPGMAVCFVSTVVSRFTTGVSKKSKLGEKLPTLFSHIREQFFCAHWSWYMILLVLCPMVQYFILHSDPVVISPSSVMDESSSVSPQQTSLSTALVPSSVTEEPTQSSAQEEPASLTSSRHTTSHLPAAPTVIATPQPSPLLDENSRTNGDKEMKIILSKLGSLTNEAW